MTATIADGDITATLTLGPTAKLNSDVALAARAAGSSDPWVVLTGRHEICGGDEAVDAADSTTYVHGSVACTDAVSAGSVSVTVDLLKHGFTDDGAPLDVRFVQYLGGGDV